MIGWEVFGIIASLVLSAFFSSSETALTALGRAQTQKLIEDGGRVGEALKLWADHPLKVLTCILIGNNIVNITASALATDVCDRLLEGTSFAETAIPIAVGVMTLLLLTFGEIVPKAIARSQHRRLAGGAMWLLKGPYLLFYPGTVLFTALADYLIKLSGGNREQDMPPVTEEDIEYLVDLGSRVGSLEEGKGKMLQSVFEYNATLVRENMVPRTDMMALDVDSTIEEVLGMVQESGHSRMPVYEDTVDNIIGIFFAKDLLQHYSSTDGAPFELRKYLRRAYFVPEAKKISDLLAEFQREHIHMAIVVDEFGGTSGLITLEDIIEEFFGDIQDEYDAETDWLVRMDGVLTVDARCPITDLEEELDQEFPEQGGYESVGGLIVATTGKVPEVGCEVVLEGIRFHVLEADEKRVIRVRVNDEREALKSSTDGNGDDPEPRRMAS